MSPLALVLCFLVACGGSGPTSPAVGPADFESASFDLVNAERSSEGLSTLARDATLDELARRFSRSMRDEGFFSHESPSGETLVDRLRAAGYPFGVAAENIAQVTNTLDPAAEAHRILMESRGHRNNILGERYERMGVGVAVRDRTVWFTQIYAGRSR